MSTDHRFLLSFGVFIALILFSLPAQAETCLVYCGAGLKLPMAELSSAFKSSTPHHIDINYGGAGHLFGMMAMGRQCDVFIPGARRYVDIAVEKSWIAAENVIPLVKHVPAIAVPRGNPASIRSLHDLATPGLKIALGDPRACAIGNLSASILRKNGIYKAVNARTRVYGPTVNQLLLYVITGKVDAAIIWEDLAVWPEGNGDIELVKINGPQNIIRHIPVAVTIRGAHNPAALEFSAFLASPQGLAIWRKWGFEPCSSLMSSN